MRCLLALLLATPAQAGPTVAVKARARLTDVSIQARGLIAEVEGTLRDNLNQQVPGAAIHVTADTTVRTTTDAQGRFAARFRLAAGVHPITIDHPGGALLGAAQHTGQVTTGRTTVRLEAAIDDPVPAARPLQVDVRATDADGQAVRHLLIGVTLDRSVRQAARTDREGAVVIDLPALPPGEHHLRLHWAGDDDRLPAELEQRFHAAAELTAALAYAGDEPPPPGRPLVFEGQVHGGPGPGLPVVLTAAGRPAGGTTTAAEGRFRFDLDPSDLPTGQVTFRALIAPEDRAYREATSNEITLDLPPLPPPSPLWTWVPVAVAGLSLGAAAWRRRPRHPRTTPAPPPPGPPPPPPFELRPEPAPAAEPILVLQVKDALTGRPLPGATAVLLAPGAAAPDPAELRPPEGSRVSCDAAGRAVLRGQGTRLWVAAAGHAPECHACALPPGGQAVVHLTPLRARVQQLYAEVLRQAGRPPLRFGQQTPREAAVQLPGRGSPTAEVDALTDLVEAACFGPVEPEGPELAAAHRLTRLVAAGMAR